jgi:hypothetical protein
MTVRHYSGVQHLAGNPSNNRLTVGSVIYADKKAIEQHWLLLSSGGLTLQQPKRIFLKDYRSY